MTDYLARYYFDSSFTLAEHKYIQFNFNDPSVKFGGLKYNLTTFQIPAL